MKQLLLSPEILEARIAPAAAVFDLADVDGSNGFIVHGEAADDQAGISVTGVGDFNGDGIDDFLVGANATPNGAGSGAAYIVFGTQTGFPASLDLSSLDGTNGIKLEGRAPGDNAGFAVSSAGDVNGDDLADVIVGAPGAQGGLGGVPVQVGAAYIVFGRTQSGPSIILGGFDGDGVTVFGDAPGSAFGSAVSGGGDFNGDGFDDVLIGAPGESGANGATGACFVIFGGSSLSSTVNVSAMTFSTGFRINGELTGDVFGASVSRAGDVNGDGIGDIIIGSPGSDSSQVDAGASYVFFGKANPTGPPSIPTLDGRNGFKITGEATGDNLGESVAAGDVNGDGFSDVIIGAPFESSNGDEAGAAYVVFGGSGIFATPLNLSSVGTAGFKVRGETALGFAGASVASGGDFNGDGIADILISAPEATLNEGSFGASYLLYGSKTGFSNVVDLQALDGTTGLKIRGTGSDAAAGSAIGVVGDVNGDGYSDLIIGAPGTDSSLENSGAAYVIYGFDTRIQMSADGKTFTFIEADGDVVTLKLSQAGLRPQDIVLAEDGSIESLDLTSFADTRALEAIGAKPLNFLMSVKTPTGGAGNGLTKVGALNAQGVSMGKVKIAGDLGKILAGGLGPTAVKSLIIQGNLGGDGATSQLSKLVGAMNKVKVLGNLQNDSFEITGKLGAISIKKDLLGADALGPAALSLIANEGLDEFIAQGNSSPKGILIAQTIGKVKIGGNVKSASMLATKEFGSLSMVGDFQNSSLFSDGGIKAVKVAGRMISDDPNDPSTMTARNKLNSLVVNGDVENARILVGYDKDEQPVNADARIGHVLVKGNWSASSLVAGIDDSTHDGFGRNDTIISGDTTPSVVSKIASVVIKGTATGSIASGDHFGITAQHIGKLSIDGATIELTSEAADDILLDPANNDFRVVEIV